MSGDNCFAAKPDHIGIFVELTSFISDIGTLNTLT